MRVLIIKTSAMGDIIHALQVPDYLHKACPGIEIDWVVEEQFQDLLSGNPLLCKLHLIKTRKWRKNLFKPETLNEVASVIKEIRNRRYDMVFDIQGNLKSGIIAWLSGVKKRVGFSLEFLQEKVNSLFTNTKIQPRECDDNANTRYLRVVSAALGKDYRDMQLNAAIHTSPADDTQADKLISICQPGCIFLFHTGTTWQTKFWSENRWIELGNALQHEFPDSTIFMTWGNDREKSSAERVAAVISGNVRVLDRYPLKQIAAVIKKVDAVIGGDTGMTHLAAAVGTPTVSYYRASDGNASGPRGNRHVIVQSPLPCTRCFRTSCDRDNECRDSITAEMVMKGIRKLQPFFRHQKGFK